MPTTRNDPNVAKGDWVVVVLKQDRKLLRTFRFTATGFPRVFYLRYHGYRKFFPLWALARYRTLLGGNDDTALRWGM